MKNLIRLPIIASFLLLACNSHKSADVTPGIAMVSLNGNSISQESSNLNNFLKLVNKGAINLASNKAVLDVIHEIANHESTYRKGSDFFASFGAVDSALSNRNLDFESILSAGLTNEEASVIRKLSQNGYKLEGKFLSCRLRFFVPAMNTQFYPGITLNVAKPSFGVKLCEASYPSFAGYKYDSNNQKYITANLGEKELLTKEVILISSWISNLEGKPYNTSMSEDAGRCWKSDKTGLCELPGTSCRCAGGKPIELIEEI